MLAGHFCLQCWGQSFMKDCVKHRIIPPTLCYQHPEHYCIFRGCVLQHCLLFHLTPSRGTSHRILKLVVSRTFGCQCYCVRYHLCVFTAFRALFIAIVCSCVLPVFCLIGVSLFLDLPVLFACICIVWLADCFPSFLTLCISFSFFPLPANSTLFASVSKALYITHGLYSSFVTGYIATDESSGCNSASGPASPARTSFHSLSGTTHNPPDCHQPAPASPW